MGDEQRRFEDAPMPGGLDPRVALGKLIAQVENVQVTSDRTLETVGKMSDDIMEIKLQRAMEAGQRKGVLNIVTLVQILIATTTSLIATWGVVKAMVPATPIGH